MFSSQQIDADGKSGSASALEHFQPGVQTSLCCINPLKINNPRQKWNGCLRCFFFFFSPPPQLTITSHHQRHHRFCLRLLLKHPENHALCVLCGHNAMVSGSFKHALGTETHKHRPRYLFCIIVACLSIVQVGSC